MRYLLFDDGFQYWKLRGRRRRYGAGRLSATFWERTNVATGNTSRAPEHLARASYIFITKSDGNTEALRKRINQHNPTAPIIECVHHPLYFEDVFTGERLNLEFLLGKKVASLSGIAQPESFEKSLINYWGGTGV